MIRNVSTAVFSVVTSEKIIVSKCGDSRAMICHNGVAIPLSMDHKIEPTTTNVRSWQVMDYGTLYQMRRRYGMCPQGAGRADCDDSVSAAVDNACSDASLLLTKFALARPSSDNVSVVVQWLTGGRGGIINHRLNN
ncbi:unnamed protein product [Arabidopsis halleri]